MTEPVSMIGISEISAIYYALLQKGYEYYRPERKREHIRAVESFIGPGSAVPSFFDDVRQSTCQVYSFWPRAALLEEAALRLLAGEEIGKGSAFYRRVMSATNLSDVERGPELWSWIADLPGALETVCACEGFHRYLEWEQTWVKEESLQRSETLSQLTEILLTCKKRYRSPIERVRLVIQPIKCVYASDHYRLGEEMLFCSGGLRSESVVHEYLHHLIHPCLEQVKKRVIESKTVYPGIDESYYLDGGPEGRRNAFEEYAVRRLTERVLSGDYPADLAAFLEEMAERV